MKSLITPLFLLLLLSSVLVSGQEINSQYSEGENAKMTILYDKPVIVRNDGLQAHFTHEIISRGVKNRWTLTSCPLPSRDDLRQTDKDSLAITQVTVEQGTVFVRSSIDLSGGCTDLNFTASSGSRFKVGDASTVIEIQNGTAEFVVTPEYNTCSYLVCYSSITVENLENETVTFSGSDLFVSAEKETNTYVEVINLLVPNFVNNVTLGSDNETIISQNTYLKPIISRRNLAQNDTLNIAPGQTAQFIITTQFPTPENTYKYNVSLTYLGVEYLIDPFFTTLGSNFTAGTFVGTELNATGFIQLTPPFLDGSYQSEIFDVNQIANWTNISWFQEVNYDAEIPNFFGEETGDFVSPINTSGLILLYHFNNDSTENSTLARDWTNNLENMSCVPGECPVLVNDGRFNKSYSFNGVSDHFETINFTSGDFGLSSFTMMFWMNTTSAGNRRIISKRSTGTGGQVEQRVDGTMRFLIDEQTVPSIFVNGITTTDDGGWHHIAAVRDTSNSLLRIYVDGIEDAVPVNEGAIGNISNPLQLSVGARDNGINAFLGQLDEVSVYMVAKSPEEVREYYLRGAVSLNLSVRTCNDENCINDSFVDLNGDSTINLNLTQDQQFFQYLFNFSSESPNHSPFLFNVTVEFEGGGLSQVFEIGECPEGLPNMLLLIAMVFVGLGIIYIGMVGNSPIVGILGSVVVILTTLFISGCSQITSLVIALFGVVMLMWFGTIGIIRLTKQKR